MKNIKTLLFVFILMFIFTMNVNADYKAAALNNSGATCSLYKGSTGYCFYKDSNLNSYNALIWLDTGDEVTVLTSYPKIESKDKKLCPGSYQYVSRYKSNKNKTYYGYYCDTYLSTGALTEELKTEFKNAGFPESYWDKLAIMKKAHPNWKFKAINLGLDFNTAVSNESIIGRSLIQVTSSTNDEGYLNTSSGSYNYYTDTFEALDGSSWFAANNATVAYYLDPRNFLSDMYIFGFEGLSYDSAISDDTYKNSINTIFAGDYLLNYTNDFLTAGKEAKVSPIYLASLSNQEIRNGLTPGDAISGKYNGMYNFYNIGATSGANPVINGLNWAAQKDDFSLRPWDTPYKSIVGGAKWMARYYISIGQDTIYFKKWDVVANINASSGKNYEHQYQTNIEAPKTEGLTTYKTKSANNLLDLSYNFFIPVYSNMPTETKLPNKGNPNNYLKSLALDGKPVADFDGAVTTYNYYTSNTSVNVSGVTVSDKSKLTGTGNYNVSQNKSIKVKVTAQNGAEKTYTINIIYQNTDAPITDNSTVQEVLNDAGIKNGKHISGIAIGTDIKTIKTKITNAKDNAIVTLTSNNGTIKESGTIVTGDKVKIKLPKEEKTYEIVIYGDVNGDGKISASDYAKVKNTFLGKVSLNDSFKEAADVNKDGKVTASDYAKIKNNFLGKSAIVQ